MKRPLTLSSLADEPPLKNTKMDAPAECVLPVQPEHQLGLFWGSSHAGRVTRHEQQRVEAACCCSLGSWAGLARSQASASLMLRSHSGLYAAPDDEDTQDTATSSGSDGCQQQKPAQLQRAPARKPRAAVTGEEDSITSSQPVPAASVAFSFGSRPYLTPDLTAVQCWDIIHHLLAAV